MSLERPIYMDNNATTRVDERVLEAMLPYFCEEYGNAASGSHAYGWRAKAAVEDARAQIAEVFGASADEIIFTSGATESDNLAIKGVAGMYADRGNHIITCQTEHKAVLDTCAALAETGCEITYLRPDEFGRVTADQVAEAITDKTVLITIMAANNETGVLHPIRAIGKAAKERGVLFHTDATQAVGKIPLGVEDLGVDLLSLSGHKIYGPKGVGALYVRRRNPRVRLAIQMHGGGHERNMRSGTLNVPGIVGMGKACELVAEEGSREAGFLAGLRDRLEQGILDRLDYVKRNGHPIERLCNTSNLSFAYVEGESLMMKMRDVAVSSGSACTSASLEPSFVLKAMGVQEGLAHSSIRFSLGRYNTADEVDTAIEQVVAAVMQLREMSAWYDDAVRRGLTDETEWTKWTAEDAASYACNCHDAACCRKLQHAHRLW